MHACRQAGIQARHVVQLKHVQDLDRKLEWNRGKEKENQTE